jgi:hypothetical protein
MSSTYQSALRHDTAATAEATKTANEYDSYVHRANYCISLDKEELLGDEADDLVEARTWQNDD